MALRPAAGQHCITQLSMQLASLCQVLAGLQDVDFTLASSAVSMCPAVCIMHMSRLAVRNAACTTRLHDLLVSRAACCGRFGTTHQDGDLGSSSLRRPALRARARSPAAGLVPSSKSRHGQGPYSPQPARLLDRGSSQEFMQGADAELNLNANLVQVCFHAYALSLCACADQCM